MTTDLERQNNGHSWLDCEARGLRHLLGKEVAVVSIYGSPVADNPSKVRRCQRCPVSFLTVGR
jgi:hypothetical protein